MSESVYVAAGDNLSETATLLLAAAAELDLDSSVVRTTTEHAGLPFVVPEEVAKKAGIKPVDPHEALNAAVEQATGGSAEVTLEPELAHGGMESGPTADEAQAELYANGDSPTPPDKAVAKKAPAKKAAAKKAPARKRATKKAAAKKAPATKEG